MRETIGIYMLVKNELPWVRQWLSSFLPVVDQFVIFDGNSTDGTLEVIEEFERNHKEGHKINLYTSRDPADLKDAYTAMFDEALHCLTTDWAAFIHPDMEPENPDALPKFLETSHGKVAAFCHMRSFGGDPGGQLYEIKEGRKDRWKNIMRLRSPSLGLHYFGHYGNGHEDMYFRAYTGDEHRHYGPYFDHYPYEVADSGLSLKHYSDVRPYERRLGRMKACLLNQDHKPGVAEKMALEHPRVTLKSNDEFKFEAVETPDFLKEAIRA